jgi:anti-sigma regulatory factor (Ser/Thr protein kinase)
VPDPMWRVVCDISGLAGCKIGSADQSLSLSESGDLVVLGDVSHERLDLARLSGFRFGLEAQVAPFWLARLLNFVNRPKALMGWCFPADTYRRLSLNLTLLRQLSAQTMLSAERQMDLDLLLTEAIVNTLEHGAPAPDSHVPASFGLFISGHEEGLEVTVVQAGEGHAFPDSLWGRLHGGIPALDAEGGRGLFLIAEIARFAWFEEEGRSLRFIVGTQ